MSSRLSFQRMIRSWQRWFGRAVGVFGLLFVAQLAAAGGACASSATGPERAFQEERCEGASPACIATAQRVDASASLASSLPPSQASAAAPGDARGISLVTVQPRSPTGLAPGSPSPLYILFRRYLS